MEKSKPYPVKVDKNKKPGKYKSKDGVHLCFPKIVIDKLKFRFLVDELLDMEIINNIFEEESEITPSNISENTILDSSISGWQPYLCSKKMKNHILLQKFI